MKIGIIQDIHANLPALRRAIASFRAQQCSKIIHVGDLIGIGPFPAECMQLVHSIDEMECIMGNHDYWYGFGLPEPIPAYMGQDEVAHQQWTHEQIGPKHRQWVRQWPFSRELDISRYQRVVFQHYGLNKTQNWFKALIKEPTPPDLDQLFEGIQGDLIFYGHHHEENDQTGKRRYVNLGSAGCYHKAEVRIGILDVRDGLPDLKKYSLPYADGVLMEAFDQRNVPARDFIRKVFIRRK